MRKAVSILLLALTVLGLGAAAFAQEDQAPGVEPKVLAVDVPGTGIIFMRLRVAPPGMTLYEYRDLIWQRIADALRPGLESGQLLDGKAVTIKFPKDGNPQIYIGEHLIVEVDKEHAILNGSTQKGLAEVWAANLALALDRWAYINRPLR